jgi:hypothetical protein
LAPDLPFTDEARHKSDAYRALVKAGGDTPGGFCLGPGMPSIILGGATYPMEIAQRPEQITILYELHKRRAPHLLRRGATRRRRIASRSATAIRAAAGRATRSSWRPQHLVEQVDQRYPHSARARVVERYRLTAGAKGERVLVIDFTLTRPGLLHETGHRAEAVDGGAGRHLLPYDCAKKGARRLERSKRLPRAGASVHPARRLRASRMGRRR